MMHNNGIRRLIIARKKATARCLRLCSNLRDRWLCYFFPELFCYNSISFKSYGCSCIYYFFAVLTADADSIENRDTVLFLLSVENADDCGNSAFWVKNVNTSLSQLDLIFLNAVIDTWGQKNWTLIVVHCICQIES